MEIIDKSFKKYMKRSRTFTIILLSISFSLFSAPDVFAAGDVTWGSFDSPKIGFEIGYGGVPSVEPKRVDFEVMDDALVGPGVNTISVNITSTLDTEGISLTLSNENEDGKIENDKIVLLRGNALFQIDDTAILSLSNVCGNPGFDCDDNVIDSFDGNDSFILAFSETSSTFVPIHLIETGKDTRNFEGKLKFTTSSSIPATFPDISELQVTLGDTISVLGISQSVTNGLILPVPVDKGGIVVEDGGAITITYVSQDGMTHTSEADITDPGSGGGGGGPVRSGLVVDSSSSDDSSGGGCSGDCRPPTLGLDKNYIRIVEGGFSFNGNAVDVEHFYTPYPMITVNVGEENIAVLKIYEDSGIDKIAHVGLAFGLGKNEYFSDSKATINLDRTVFGTEIKNVYDPENVLDNVRVVTEKTTCSASSNTQCLVVTFYHTFREPLEFNMLSTIVWDQDRNSWQNFYNHGIEIIGQSLNPPDEHIGIYKGNLISLLETGKNTSVDKEGNTWTFDREWKMDFKPKGKIDNGITSHGYDRNHVQFEAYKKEQDLIAQYKLNVILDGKSIQNDDIKEPKTYSYKILSRSEDLELQNAIEYEIMRAEHLFSNLFEEIKHNHID